MRHKKGFTLIELLVVIAIIALLLSVIMPALRKAKALALRLTCTSNLHQVGMAMYCYAAINEETLPIPEDTTVGDWLFDFPEVGAEFIHEEYDTIDIMYCPANSLKEYSDQELMELYESHMQYGWVVTDYFWVMTFGLDWRREYEYEDDSRFHGRRMFTEKLAENVASGHPLVTDATFTQDPDGTDDQDFSDVVGYLYFRTNHLKGIEAEGGNIVYCDGSTEWLDFSKMEYTYNGGGTYHYW